jgi:hypothetical protein
MENAKYTDADRKKVELEIKKQNSGIKDYILMKK